jgi:transposase
LPAARLRSCRKRPGMSQQDQLDLREELYRISGIDLTRIDGISLQTAQKVFFEIGTDVSAWSNEKKFASWLGLSPNHRISGGKVLKRSSRKVVNPLSVALRLAAHTLLNSHSALGANFRRLIAKIGMPKAITAMARKLAVLIYRMIKYGTQYVDKGMQHYEAKYQATKVQYLRTQAAKLGNENRKHCKLLTISEIHPVFMGRTRTIRRLQRPPTIVLIVVLRPRSLCRRQTETTTRTRRIETRR